MRRSRHASAPPDSAIVRTYVTRLRRRLAGHPEALARLRTVRGVGYAFDLDL
jgi:DNA-binding response OmpR family regulator